MLLVDTLTAQHAAACRSTNSASILEGVLGSQQIPQNQSWVYLLYYFLWFYFPFLFSPSSCLSSIIVANLQYLGQPSAIS